MRLGEAIALCLDEKARDDSGPPGMAESRALSLAWLEKYFGNDRQLDELTPARLRDFLARWFIENASLKTCTASVDVSSRAVPDAAPLANSLTDFVNWAAQHVAFTTADACLAVIAELRDRLPRALALSAQLSTYLAERGGAFAFPQFLTSFHAGGHSEYDLDAPGEAGCREGYFRIIRVEDDLVEAEEVITESRLFPIGFPEHIAVLLEPDDLINLELIYAGGVWQIAACGFAYPPGTEL